MRITRALTPTLRSPPNPPEALTELMPPRLGLTIAAVTIVAIFLRIFLMPGLGGTDDVLYALRGLELAQGNWRYTTDPAELRFGIVWPIALLSQVVGSTDFSLSLWSLLCSSLEIVAVMLLAGRFWGKNEALVAGVLMAVAPIHISLAGRPLADAPFASFITLAFTGLLLAEVRQSAKMALISGISLGMCWWIKPTATIPLLFIFLASIPVFWRLFKYWWLILISFLAMVCAEWLLLWIKYDDPLHTLRVLLPFLRTHQNYSGDPFWGTNAPAFYFRLLFLDMREMWILPHLAVLGVIGIAISRPVDATKQIFRRFALYWPLMMLFAYSFFVISTNPVKFIPKQENYAVIFVAPLALAAAWGLARLNRALQIVAVMLTVAISLLLAGLEQQNVQNKQSRLDQALEWARKDPTVTALVSSQTVKLASLQTHQGKPFPDNLTPLSAYYPATLSPGLSPTELDTNKAERRPEKLVLVMELSSGSSVRPATQILFDDIKRCATPIQVIDSKTHGLGNAVTNLVQAAIPHLPPVIARQAGFTEKIISPPRTVLYRLSAECPPPPPLGQWASTH